jgi:hypothetical protein
MSRPLSRGQVRPTQVRQRAARPSRRLINGEDGEDGTSTVFNLAAFLAEMALLYWLYR